MDVLIILAALPVFLIGLFIYSKDRNKEPKSLLFKLLAGGIGSVFLTLVITAVIEGIYPPFATFEEDAVGLEQFLCVFLGVALVEEFSKWIFAYKISYNNKEFDELYDMIIYCVFVALGFAFFENIAYVLQGGVAVAFTRAIFAVPGHAADGVFMGYFLGLAKLYDLHGKENLRKKNMALSLIVPMLLHGTYDYLLFIDSSTIIILLFLALVIMLYVFSIKQVNKTSSIKEGFYRTAKYCSNCGKEVTGAFCSNCGKKVE